MCPRSTRSAASTRSTRTQIERLLAGVKLIDDPATVRAAACEATGECTLRLTLTEGKYHQVKRMLAAVGNRVETLHRSAIGGVALPRRPGARRAGPGSTTSQRLALGLPGHGRTAGASADNR